MDEVLHRISSEARQTQRVDDPLPPRPRLGNDAGVRVVDVLEHQVVFISLHRTNVLRPVLPRPRRTNRLRVVSPLIPVHAVGMGFVEFDREYLFSRPRKVNEVRAEMVKGNTMRSLWVDKGSEQEKGDFGIV